MAVSGSNVTHGTSFNAGGITSATTASITPSANNLILITITSRNGASTDPNHATVSGCSLTWVEVNSVAYDTGGTSRRRLTVLRALGTPTTGSLTIDFAGQSQTSIDWVVDQFSGVDTTGTNGSGAVVQTASNADVTATAHALTVTLAAFSSVNNATWGGFATGGVASNTTRVGAGFTSLGTDRDSNGDEAILTEFNSANDTTVDFDLSDAFNTELGGIAVEIKAATSAFLPRRMTMGIG